MTIEGTADKGTLREALTRDEWEHVAQLVEAFGPSDSDMHDRLRAALSSKDEPLDVERSTADAVIGEYSGVLRHRRPHPEDTSRCAACRLRAIAKAEVSRGYQMGRRDSLDAALLATAIANVLLRAGYDGPMDEDAMKHCRDIAAEYAALSKETTA